MAPPFSVPGVAPLPSNTAPQVTGPGVPKLPGRINEAGTGSVSAISGWPSVLLLTWKVLVSRAFTAGKAMSVRGKKPGAQPRAAWKAPAGPGARGGTVVGCGVGVGG